MKRIASLDSMRGIAAMVVVLGHYAAVSVFFVLSGPGAVPEPASTASPGGPTS